MMTSDHATGKEPGGSTPLRVVVTSRSFSKNPLLRKELLETFPHAKFNDADLSLSGDALVEFLQGFDAAVIGLERIDGKILARLPELRVISKYGVGLDMLDLAALRACGVRLGWCGGVNKRAVAELTLCMMLALFRNVMTGYHLVKSGGFKQVIGRELSGRTVGIIGCGHVGKDLVRLLQPFGCRILVRDLLSFPDFYHQFNVEPVALDLLLRESDAVTVHVPLDQSTRKMIGARELDLMRPSAILLNLARGGIIDEAALKERLKTRRIAGAGFDVFDPEPPLDRELVGLDNFFTTPHVGGSSEEAIMSMGRAAIAGLRENALPVIGT